MTQATIGIRSFNGGQLDPRAVGRTDLPSYSASGQIVKNWIPRVAGSLTRRPGTWYAATALDPTGATPSRLIRFEVGSGEYYMIELSAYKMRVFKDNGPLTYASRDFFEQNIINGHLFNHEFGHGFYHNQAVEFTANPPSGFALGTTYYVQLARSININTYTSGVWDTMTRAGGVAAAPELTHQMGPYRLLTDMWSPATAGSYPSNMGEYLGGDFFISNYVGAAGDFRLEWGVGLPYTINYPQTNGKCVQPLPRCLAQQFSLATAFNDPSTIVRTGAAAGTATIAPLDTAEEVIFDTPYDGTEIWDLTFSQGTDRLYFYHVDHPIYEMTRWNVGAFLFNRTQMWATPLGETAPFKSNGVMTATYTAAFDSVKSRGRLAYWTLANGAYFNTGHIGQTFSIRPSTTGLDEHAAKARLIGKIEGISGMEWFGHPESHTLPAVAASTITITGHGWSNGDPVSIKKTHGKALPPGLAENTVYWVINAAANTFQLAATSGGPNILTNGGDAGHLIITLVWIPRNPVTWAASAGSSFSTGPNAVITGWGEMPSGLTMHRRYKLVVLDPGTGLRIYFADEATGEPIPLSSPGHGMFTVSKQSVLGKTDIIWVRETIDTGQSTAWRTTTSAKWRWAVGEWGADAGYPRAGTIYQGRHVVGGNYRNPNRVWFSATTDEVNFLPVSELEFFKAGGIPEEFRSYDPLDESGFAIDPVSNLTSEIRWIYGHNILIAASSSEIFEIAASTNREGLTPSNANARIVSVGGTANVLPVRARSDLIFISSTHSRVDALLFDGASSASEPTDLTQLAKDALDSEIVQLAWTEEPLSCLWMVRKDGRLYGCTYDRENDVVAWHYHELGGSFGGNSYGFVNSAVGVSHDDASDERGSYDRLWLSVKRTINGATLQVIEYLDQGVQPWTTNTNLMALDCAPPKYSGPATGTPFTGLTYLEGEEVVCLTDGVFLAGNRLTVSSGTFTLPGAVVTTSAICGLEYDSIWQSVPLESTADQQEITIQGQKKRIVDLWLRTYRAYNQATGIGTQVQVGQDANSLVPVKTNPNQTTADPGGALYPVRAFPHEWSDQATIYLKVNGGMPFELLALQARLEWSER